MFLLLWPPDLFNKLNKILPEIQIKLTYFGMVVKPAHIFMCVMKHEHPHVWYGGRTLIWQAWCILYYSTEHSLFHSIIWESSHWKSLQKGRYFQWISSNLKHAQTGWCCHIRHTSRLGHGSPMNTLLRAVQDEFSWVCNSQILQEPSCSTTLE